MPQRTMKDAAAHVHTPESWARAVAATVMQASDAGTATPGFSATPGIDCVEICYDSPWGRICVCV